MKQTRNYFAFISYSSKDQEWGKRLQDKLEAYRLPTALCRKKGWEKKPMNPIFFAPTEIQPGSLTDEIKKRLEASAHLIVICSPNSAKSEWVGREIEYFYKNLGRKENVHFFIINGIPHSQDKSTECFNPVVEKLCMPEILGVNINEKVFRWSYLNKERAYIQLVSKMLGIEFDSIWRRHKRRLINKLLCLLLMLFLSLNYIYVFAIPFQLTVNIRDEKHNLPMPKDAELIINDSHYPLKSLDTTIVKCFSGIWKFRTIDIEFNGTYYKQIKSTISPHYYWYDTKLIKLQRDSTFAIYSGNVVYGEWQPLENVKIKIGNQETYTNQNGDFTIYFPISQQTISKKVVIEKNGFIPIVKPNEAPGNNIGYILIKK